jgi:hypothetical protein
MENLVLGVGNVDVLEYFSESVDNIFYVHLITVLILEVFHVDPCHIPQNLDNHQLNAGHLAVVEDELVDANPVAVLQPLFELR